MLVVYASKIDNWLYALKKSKKLRKRKRERSCFSKEMAPKALNALKLSGYYLSIWKIMPEFTADLVYGQRL